MVNAGSIHPRLLMPTLVVFFTWSCGTSTPTDPAEAPRPSANRGQPDQELPFQLSGDAVLLGQDFAPGFGPPTFGRSDFDGRCSVPSDFVINFALEGRATHLGKVTAVAEHCTLLDFATGGFSESDGVMIFTTANGDELWSDYQRTTNAVPEDHEFVGGTGRFAGASGGGRGRPDCDRAAGTCVFELEGVIVYDASSRSE